MTEAFTFDTSGEVPARHIDPATGEDRRFGTVSAWRWSDLTPFQQGTLEAASREFFDGLDADIREAMARGGFSVAFSDWGAEALAMILADCEAFNAKIGDASHNPGIGAKFWESRQTGFAAYWSLHQAEFAAAFPVLTVSLGEDGKIRLCEARP